MRTEVSGRFQTSLCAGFNVVISPLEPEPSARSQMTEETKKKKRERSHSERQHMMDNEEDEVHRS